MKKSRKDEITTIQEMIDEYQLLWKDIQERIVIIKKSIKKQAKQQASGSKKEVDESVQVETLKFEQDSAVQVNTLPPRLQRMTSISAKDAYLMELNSGLAETKTNIENLESLVASEVPQQGSPELHMTAKKIAKLLATCQSNVELIEHLCEVLKTECNATEVESKSEEVQYLVNKFIMLMESAKSKEQKIRELR